MKVQGYYTEAEDLYARSLQIQEMTLPDPYHPDLASFLNNLAVLKRTLGKYKVRTTY